MVGTTQLAEHRPLVGLLDVPSESLVLQATGPGNLNQQVRLGASKTTIGAAPACTIRIPLDGVPPIQCSIFSGARGTVVHSWADGTLLNGTVCHDAALHAGDRLTIGPVEFEVLNGPLPDHRPNLPNSDRDLQRAELSRRHARHRARRLLAELRAARWELASWQADVARRSAAIEQLETTINSLEASVAELTSRSHGQQEELNRQAASQQDQAATLASRASAIESLEQRATEAETAASQVREQLAAVTQRADQVAFELEIERQQRLAVSQECQATTDRWRQLQSECQRLQAAADESARDAATLRQTIADLKAGTDESDKQVALHVQQIAELIREREDVAQQLAAARAQHAELTQQLDRVRSDFDQGQATQIQAQIEQTAAVQQLAETRQELIESRERLQRTLFELDELRSAAASISPIANTLGFSAPPQLIVNFEPLCSQGPTADLAAELPVTEISSVNQDDALARLSLAGIWRDQETTSAAEETPSQAASAPTECVQEERVQKECVQETLAQGVTEPSVTEPEAFHASPEIRDETTESVAQNPRTVARTLARPPSHEAVSRREHASTDEDSIESYMARLMHRVRGEQAAKSYLDSAVYEPASSDTREDSNGASTFATAPTEAKAAGAAQVDPEATNYIPRAVPPEFKANLAAMREVANSSTRQAIETHQQDGHRQTAKTQILAAAGAALGGTVILVMSRGKLWEYAGFGFAAVAAAYWLWNGMRQTRFAKLHGSPSLPTGPAPAADSSASPT